MLETLFQKVLQVSMSTSIVIGVLLLLLPLINRSYSAKWRYLVWLIIAVRLLIPFSPSIAGEAPVTIPSVSQNVQIPIPLPANTNLSEQTNIIPTQPTPVVTPNSSAVRTITLADLLPVIWLIGAILFMTYYFAGYIVFRKSAMRFSEIVEDEQTLATFSQMKQEMGIRGNIELIRSKKVQSPMITGFVKPIFLLPYVEYSEADLELIMKHELIHYKHKDIWNKLVMVVANAVHWFNPLVYVMRYRSNADIEMACDSELVEGTGTEFRKQYSETILSAIHKGRERETVFSTYFYGGVKTMKERLGNIFDGGGKRGGIVALCLVVVAVIVIGALVACGGSTAAELTAEEKAQITELLDNFGRELTNVTIIDPENVVAEQIKEHYTPYLTSNLLSKWVLDPSLAMGRTTSSPWPDRIEVDSMEKVDNDRIKVQGYVVWVASGGQNGVEVTATVPAVFFVKKDSSTGKFLIDNAFSNKYAFYDTEELTKMLQSVLPEAGSQSEPFIVATWPVIDGSEKEIALAYMGTGGAYVDYYTLCIGQDDKLALANFKDEDGAVGPHVFSEGASVKHEVRLSVYNASPLNFYVYQYQVDRDDSGAISNIDVEAYRWNMDAEVFEFDADASQQFKEELENSLDVDKVILAQLSNALREALVANYSPYYKDIGIDLTLDPRADSFTVKDGVASAILDANITATLKAEKLEDMPFVKGMLDYLESVRSTLTDAQLDAANDVIDDWKSELSGYIGKPEPTSYATYKVVARVDDSGNIDKGTVKFYIEQPSTTGSGFEFYPVPDPMFDSEETLYRNGQNAVKEAIEKAGK